MPISNTAPDQRIWVTRNNGGAGFVRLDRDGADTAASQMDVYASTAGIIRPTDIVFDTVHGLYFFSDSINGNRRILQGNIAELLNPVGPPTLTVLYSDSSPGTAGGQILGLAIDVDAATGQGHIYFVNQGNLDRVVYDHDGTSPTNQVPAILATLPPGGFANEIALDIDNNRAFILSTASSTEAVEVPEGTPGAIFDEDSGIWFIFATDVTNNEIWQVSGLDRTDMTTADTSIARLNFIGGDNGGQDLQDSLGLLQSIDIDPTTGLLYFTTQQINSGAFGEVGGIYRYNLAAGTYETLYTEGNATDYSFEYIDVDPVSGRYYVSSASFDDTSGANTSSIFVHGLSAGTPTVFASVANPAGAVPQGLIVVNAPTLNGAESGATTTETAGPGSGQSSAAQPLATPDANDGDSAGQIDQLAGAQVRISAGFGSSPGSTELLAINGTTAGVLDFGNQDISYSYNGLTGVMTLSGASTFANYEAALALVAYSISGDNPDNGGASTSRTLAYSVTDGMLFSDEFNVNVTIVATNDAPVNATGGAVATSEDAASAAVTGLSVSDPDSGALTVTISVGRGTLTLSGTAGLAFATGDGTADATMTFTGTSAAINAALGGLTYTPTANLNGPDTLTMTTSDGSLQDIDNVAINVAAVNDAPTVAGDGTESAAPIQEDMPSATGQTVSALFGGQYSDAADQVSGGSSANAFAGVAVTANGSSGATGQWQYHNGATWVNIGAASTSSAVLLAASTSIRFNPAPDFSGAAPTLTVHLVDASGGALTNGAIANLSVTGGTTAYSTGTVVLSEQVTAFNDAPTGVTGSLSAPEDANNGTAAGTIVGQDPDSSSFTYTLLNNAGGRYAMDSAGNVTVADGLLLDYEQASSHIIRVRVTDDMGAYSDFDVNVSVLDVLGEDVNGDNRDNIFFGGAEHDVLKGNNGNDTLKGGGGADTLDGGNHDDILDGGAGADILTGGSGADVFIFRKGEANGDVVMDFKGQGSGGDEIHLLGYAAGTTFTRIGNGSSDLYQINDHGFIEYVTIHGPGHVNGNDVIFGA